MVKLFFQLDLLPLRPDLLCLPRRVLFFLPLVVVVVVMVLLQGVLGP